MAQSAHPESVLRAASGREVQLKVHQCNWSRSAPGNSLAAIQECLSAGPARAEIDIALLADGHFLVLGHDLPVAVRTLSRADAAQLRVPHQPPVLADVVEVMLGTPGPTLLELDMMDVDPVPTGPLEALARLVEPVKERVVFNNVGDWNLRRLLRIDPSLLVGCDPAGEIDWVPDETAREEGITLPRGAYGYLDAHPLARERHGSVADYVFDRLGGTVRLVPGARELHLRLSAFERMLDDGVSDVVEIVHRAGMVLDVWTLDAGSPGWRERLPRAVEAGVDVITTNTPRELARAI
jgi:glycerophosphoryl diester phosphodiesterase